jgi:ATP-dependent RNA helicase
MDNKYVNYNTDNIEDLVFKEYKIDEKKFNSNYEDLVYLHNFNDAYPYYDRENGLHLKLTQKHDGTKIYRLKMNVVNATLMGKWDKLNSEEFAKISDAEYDEFMETFLSIKRPIVTHLIEKTYARGFESPSVIQSAAIPCLIERKDALFQFLSGSGKTHTVLFGMLYGFDINDKNLQYIFVTTSHEVARQIYEQVVFLLPVEAKVSLCIGQGGKTNTGSFKQSNLLSGSLIGSKLTGKNQRPQTMKEKMEDVHNAQVLVGSMGTLFLYIFNTRHQALKISNLKGICVDEFDNIVHSQSNSRNSADMQKQMQMIIEEIPPSAQRVFCSATVTNESLEIAYRYFRPYSEYVGIPLIILLSPDNCTLDGIRQYYITVRNIEEKEEVLIDIINQCRINQCIIFINRIETANDIKCLFASQSVKIETAVLHSGLNAETRNMVQKDFREGKYRILISTNVIARGFDVQSINLVINFDMPWDIQTYIHRIGRSGRYGRKGVAISMILVDNEININEMKKVETLNSCSETNKLIPLPNNISELL